MSAFVSAMEINPKDTELILKVARALVTTHDYTGSIDYYNKVDPFGLLPAFLSCAFYLHIRDRKCPFHVSLSCHIQCSLDASFAQSCSRNHITLMFTGHSQLPK